MDLEHRLAHAVTRYDRKMAGKKGYNIYALGIYLGRCADVAAAVQDGVNIHSALRENFSDSLLRFVLKELSLDKDD